MVKSMVIIMIVNRITKRILIFLFGRKTIIFLYVEQLLGKKKVVHSNQPNAVEWLMFIVMGSKNLWIFIIDYGESSLTNSQYDHHIDG